MEQKKQEKDLKKVQSQRESTLRLIDKTLEQDQSRLENLRSNEQALKQQLEQAQREAQQAENVNNSGKTGKIRSVQNN